MSCYAVLWSEPHSEVDAGKLELEPASIRFQGSHLHRVYYVDIERVRIGHDVRDRLGGRPALVVDLVEGGSLRIGSVNGTGTVAELADELTRLSGQS